MERNGSMNEFIRLEKMLTKEESSKIKSLKVLIIGVGGVGGYAIEALARMGIHKITIFDHDVFEESNLNRQILATKETLLLGKATTAKKRIQSITDAVKVEDHNEFFHEESFNKLNHEEYDFIIDACDTITTKKDIIVYAINHNIPFISCMGTGNRLDPTKLQITTLDKTQNDPLAKVMRKLLKDLGYVKKIPVVASWELPRKVGDRTPGSSSLVPSVAGIYCATFAILETLKKK